MTVHTFLFCCFEVPFLLKSYDTKPTSKLSQQYVYFQDELVGTYIQDYRLNEDQAEAIKRVGSMFSMEKSDNTDNVLLIHGKPSASVT